MTTRGDQRTNIDRKSWPSFYELIAEATLSGRGEYLMDEPMYFGRAFARKPLMSYEVTYSTGTISVEMAAPDIPDAS